MAEAYAPIVRGNPLIHPDLDARRLEQPKDLVNQELVEPKEAYFKAIDKPAFANALKAAGHDTSFLDIEAVAAESAESPAKGAAATTRKKGTMVGR